MKGIQNVSTPQTQGNASPQPLVVTATNLSVLSVKRIRNKNYHIDLAREDYYRTGGEAPGKWQGRGAERLGLRGRVAREKLHRLMDGFSPDGSGKKLVQNAGTKKVIYRNQQSVRQEKEREIGWDFTFSVPKTFGVEWSQGDQKKRTALERILEDATGKTLRWLEERAVTRRGKGGAKREPTQLVMALFEHGTSRELDPQPHIHCLVLNVGVRQDGTTGAIQIDELLKLKMTAGALFRAELAQQLSEKLGYEIDAHLKGKEGLFDIKGVDPKLVAEFSKRRKAIEERLEVRGESSAVAAAVAALDTRQPKGEIPSRAELFEIWQEIGQQFGYKPPVPGFPRRDREKMKRKTAEKATQELLEKQGCFSRNDLLRRVAEIALGSGLGIEEIEEAVEERLAEKDIIDLGQRSGKTRYSSTQIFPLGKQGTISGVETWEAIAQWQQQHPKERVIAVASSGRAALRLQNKRAIKSYSLHRFANKLRDSQMALDDKTWVVLEDLAIPRHLLAELMEWIERGNAQLVLMGTGSEFTPLCKVAQEVQPECQEPLNPSNSRELLLTRKERAVRRER